MVLIDGVLDGNDEGSSVTVGESLGLPLGLIDGCKEGRLDKDGYLLGWDVGQS